MQRVPYTLVDSVTADIQLNEFAVLSTYSILQKMGYVIASTSKNSNITTSVNKGTEHLILAFGSMKCHLIDKSEFVSDFEEVFTDLGEQYTTGLTGSQKRFTIQLDYGSQLKSDQLAAKLEALGIDTVVMSNTLAAVKSIPNSIKGLNLE
jgi:hypothetical protein